MAITEIVVPSLQNTKEARVIFETVAKPALAGLLHGAPGSIKAFMGPLILENNVNVEGEVRFALGAEWQTVQHFTDLATGERFKTTFLPLVMPIATAAPETQLYDTGVSPVSAFSAPLTEVVRVRIGGDVTSRHVEEAWAAYAAALGQQIRNLQMTSGLSLNLDGQLFVGILGWEGLEARIFALSNSNVKVARGVIEGFGGVSSFVARLELM